MKLIGPSGTELLQFLTGYVTLRCDLDLWPFDLGVMSRDATWVVDPCTKFELDIRLTVPELGRLQFSIDRQLKVPIFTFFGRKGGQISNLIFLTPKGTTLAKTTYNDVLSVGMCPKMRPVGVSKKGKKRTETFMRQTGYLPRPPTSTYAPEILRAGSCPGNSYIFQVSWKSVQGSRSCGGSKIALSHWQGPWLIQQLVLPCKPW